MALPPTIPRPPRGGERQPYGVVLFMEAGDSFYDIEVLRAPDSTGTPSTASAVTFAVVAGTAQRLTDFQPNDGTYRHYLARHVKYGYPNGADTSWFRAKPVVLPGRFGEVL